MAEQRFVYTCRGDESSDFFVTLPVPHPDDRYHVAASTAGLSMALTIDLPNGTDSDRTDTQFRVRTSRDVLNGERIEFYVTDPLRHGALALNPLAFGARFDGDPSRAHENRAALQACIEAARQSGTPAASVIRWPEGTIYVTGTLLIEAFTGLSIVAQGKFSTQIVWAGPQPGEPTNPEAELFKFDGCQDSVCCASASLKT